MYPKFSKLALECLKTKESCMFLCYFPASSFVFEVLNFQIFKVNGSPGLVLQEELESVQKRAARFVTGTYN